MKYIWRSFIFIGAILLAVVLLFIVTAVVSSLWKGDYSPFTRLWGMMSNDYGKILAVYIITSLVFAILMWGESDE